MAKRVLRLGVNEIANRPLNIGFTGENDHTLVMINCTDVLSENPDAEIVLRARPTEGEIYEPEIEVEDGVVTWTILEPDISTGNYQLTFIDGTEVFKSAVGSYTNNSSLPNP